LDELDDRDSAKCPVVDHPVRLDELDDRDSAKCPVVDHPVRLDARAHLFHQGL
jgi:hypothetical protein